MNARDELAKLLFITDNHSPDAEQDWLHLKPYGPKYLRGYYDEADAVFAAGYSKPRTITDHYAEGGTDSLRGGTVILSNGEALLVQSDGTFCDPTGSTWDFWELELPISVLYEPESAA